MRDRIQVNGVRGVYPKRVGDRQGRCQCPSPRPFLIVRLFSVHCVPGRVPQLETLPGKRERDFAPDLQWPLYAGECQSGLDVFPRLSAWPRGFQDRTAGRVGQQRPHGSARGRAELAVPFTLGPVIKGFRADDVSVRFLNDILAKHWEPESAAQRPGQCGLTCAGQAVYQYDKPPRDIFSVARLISVTCRAEVDPHIILQ
jgi:hypothetical protein